MATQNISMEFDGAGSQALDLFSPDSYATFTGAGELDIDLFSPDSYAVFAGAGEMDTDLYQPYIYLEFDGVGGWIESDVQVDHVRATWSGAGTLYCDLYEFNINNVDYAAEDGTTLYVTEDGTTQYTTEWAPATNVFYVTENGNDNYVIEGTVVDYTTEDTLTNYTTEDGTQPYYALGGGGFLWDYVPENYQPATNFIFAEDWRGVGGFTFNVVYADKITAKFAGVGGWTIDVIDHPIRQPVTATWNGVGGWTLSAINTIPARQDIEAAWNGVGGFTASPQQVDQIAASWAGVGGFSCNLSQTPAISATWNGVGGWTINLLSSHADVIAPTTWNGVGGWSIDLIATFVGPSISATWNGVGGWSIDLTRIAAPGEFPANFCLLDPVWRRLYNDTMEVGQPTTLLINVGIPVHNPILTITRPDGSSYQATSVLVGKQSFPSEIYFGPMPYPSFQANQYVVYGFGLNELNQPGRWSVVLQSSSVTVTMPFTVNLLGASLLAA